MKTSAKVIIFLVILLTSSDIFSQDTANARYFPLKVGNSWTYHYKNQFFQTYRHKYTITQDSIINGKKYFNISGYNSYGWIRYDSLTSNLIAYRPGYNCSNYPNHIIIDSLGASINNTINCQFFSIYTRTCISIGNHMAFGNLRTYKEFYHDGLTTEKIKYVKDFGMVNLCWGEPTPCVAASELIGCVIDGVVYGDTTLTYVEQIGNSVPDKFELKQNYPNPFNPATNIKFSISKSSFVNLKVYDVNGQEISTLVNENLHAGEYQTPFNASDLSSGIYFYTLKTNEFTDTKRMLLVK